MGPFLRKAECREKGMVAAIANARWTNMAQANEGTNTKAGRALALLLFAMVANARDTQGTALRTTATEVPPTATSSPAQTAIASPASQKTPAAAPKISYVDGQLSIKLNDSTLAEVLTQVAALTGVQIDVPAGASAERITFVELGPGPARQVLASLLSESTFDYVIQSSAIDPEKMQSVLLMPREKKAENTGVVAATRPSRNPYARAAAHAVEQSEEPSVPEGSVQAPPESPGADANSANPQPPPTPPDSPTAPASSQPGQSNLTRPGAMSPPATLSPQSMSQQLQQMYQQRMQMVQQERQIGQSATPTNPGSN